MSLKREPEIVVFESRPKKEKKSETKIGNCSGSAQNKTASSVLDMKKVRYEVYKFGISGFSKEKMADARVALAIKLGAKPPKRTYKNYKELMEERKQQRIQQKEEREINKRMGINISRGNRRKNRDQNDVRNFQCQVGKYKQGIQYISKKDIAGIKKKK